MLKSNFMKVYFISGIGADRRIFNHVTLPAGFEIIHLDWIIPRVDENLPEYAMRLAEKIDREEAFILVGLSLGGIMATEISKQMRPHATIIISSISRSSELPPYFRFAKRFNLHRNLPTGLIRATATLKHKLIRQKAHDRKIILEMIRDADSFFFKWAVNAVLEWQNETDPDPLWHIHGTRDEVFPMRYTRPTHIIRKANHSLVTTHWAELNSLLRILVQK